MKDWYEFSIGNRIRKIYKCFAKPVALVNSAYAVFESDIYENKDDAIRDAKKKADEMGHIMFAVERHSPNKSSKEKPALAFDIDGERSYLYVTFFSKGFCDTDDGWGVLE